MTLLPLLILFILFALVGASPWLTPAFRAIERGFGWLARMPILAAAIIFVFCFAIDMLPTVIGQAPIPNIHDEFAYLLLGDTFAHGRLTNPPLPDDIWPSFETFHVIQRPTYAAKFPIGQGIALAIGQMLGHPIIGAWLGTAAACCAIFWMLRAWMPPRWAFAGALLVAIQPTIFTWSQSYWGGAVAMIGGALLVGAARRTTQVGAPSGFLRPDVILRVVARNLASLRARPDPSPSTAQDDKSIGTVVRNGVILGAGLAILANSRPFEGLLLAVLVGITMLWQLIRKPHARRLVAGALGAAVVLLPTAIFMLYYNWRVTGDAMTLPYTAHARQYMAAPLFYWQKPQDPPPQYRHEVMRKFFIDDELGTYQRERSGENFWQAIGQKLTFIWDAFINPRLPSMGAVERPQPLWILLLALPLVLWRRRGAWMLLAIVLLFLLSHFASTPWFRVQYLAPVIGCFFVLVMLSTRQLCSWKAGNWWIGRGLIAAAIVLNVVGDVYWARELQRLIPATEGFDRARLLRRVEDDPGKHVVLLRYGPRHPPTFEFVFNGADLSGSRVIFARWIDTPSANALHRYFPNRSFWLMEMDEPEGELLHVQF